MSGSVKQARKGLRPHKGTKSEVIYPDSTAPSGPNKMTKGQSRPAEAWLKK